MRSHRLVIFLFITLASFFTFSGCVTPLRVAECELNPAQNLSNEMNRARSQEGVPLLWANLRLASAATAHAHALAEGRASGHIGADGSDPLKRIEEAGYLPRGFGENVAIGTLAPELIVKAWLESPAHREVLLAPSYLEVGLGGVLDSDRPIWVADFGSEREPPKTKCHPWPIQR